MNKEIDQPSGQSNDPESEHRFDSLHTVNRRQLLKTLAAVMGAAALSSVPNRWKTPVIDVGMLPAHAQGLSGLGAISGTVFASGLLAPIRRSAPSRPGTSCITDTVVTVVGTGLFACVDFGNTYTINNVPPGTYTVTVEDILGTGCTTPSPISGVVVHANQTTPNVDFDFSDCPAHGSRTFGGSAPFPVPVGVTSLTIEAWGAAGSLGAAFTSLTPVRTKAPASGVATSALGGYVKATITVTPGEVLSVVVGTLGADGVSSDGSGPGPGGFGGSQGGVTTGGDGGTGPFGPGGGGGGGASFVLRGATTLLVVAGAGGGSGGQGSSTLSIPGSGGAGGGTTGQNGTSASGNAGASGSPGAGGVGGIGGATAPAGSTGTSGGVSAADNPGQGGTGGAGSVGNSGGGVGGGSGGGGGGGWTGGGGGGGGGGEGGSGGGGGGGSSYTIPSATLVTHTQGVKADNGQVILTW